MRLNARASIESIPRRVDDDDDDDNDDCRRDDAMLRMET